MSDMLETITAVALVLLLYFLFNGEPDVWDMLHARAMEYLKP